MRHADGGAHQVHVLHKIGVVECWNRVSGICVDSYCADFSSCYHIKSATVAESPPPLNLMSKGARSAAYNKPLRCVTAVIA